jgi:phosphatidylglycerol:prolipoprotein diacylglycerol transferase
MHPIFINLFGRPIYWYGVMTALGFLAAVFHWSWLARKTGRPAGVGSELGIWVMICGIVGARVAYVLANFEYYAAVPLEIVRIDRGGQIYYGGFIGATLGVIVLARLRKESLWAFGDFVVTGLPLGHAIGRFGCFLNGCCYGTPSDVPWRIFMRDVYRHPTQIYESLFNLALYALLVAFFLRRKRPGTVFALYLVAYSVGRFTLEFLRGDDRAQWLGLSVAQVISVALFILGCALFALLPGTRKEVDAEPARSS